jgi:hypothetical protein
VTLNPDDFPQTKLKAKVIAPGDPLPPRAPPAASRKRLVIHKK